MTTPASNLPKIDLFCTTGGASKEYHLFTVANPAGDFTLFYSNGKIGDAMKPKVKTGPASLEAIQKAFDKTVKEKTGASPPYTEASSGVVYATSTEAGEISGWLPQLLTEIQEDGLEALMRHPNWFVQEKKNGERRGLLIKDGEVRGMNKKGRYVGGVPQKWVDALRTLPDDTIIDGEHVGDKLYVFDSPRIGGEDLTARPYSHREARIHSHLDHVREPSIQMLFGERTEETKRALFERVRAETGEGIVLRKADAPYVSGTAANVRSADCLKYKFYESSSCIVREKNSGRSVAVDLLDANGQPVPVGSVTIPPNHAIPAAGDIVEVRYMHMFEGGKLYGPPVYLGPRNDVDHAECTLAQVKRIVSKANAVDEDGDDEPNDAQPDVARERARG